MSGTTNQDWACEICSYQIEWLTYFSLVLGILYCFHLLGTVQDIWCEWPQFLSHSDRISYQQSVECPVCCIINCSSTSASGKPMAEIALREWFVKSPCSQVRHHCCHCHSPKNLGLKGSRRPSKNLRLSFCRMEPRMMSKLSYIYTLPTCHLLLLCSWP